MGSFRPLVFLVGVVVALFAAAHALRYDILAARILHEYATEPPMAHAVEAKAGRLYMPESGAHPHGVVLVHGVNEMGADDPRIVGLAGVLAEHGVAVLTPRIPSLSALRVEPEAVTQIGEAATWLDARLGSGPVTIMGFSFAGGLSLLTATDPAFAPHIRAVVSVGGYDSLARVANFLATGDAPLPTGAVLHIPPDEYGAYVYVLLHAAELFPPAQRAQAETALRDRMRQHPAAADADVATLSGDARVIVEDLFQNRLGDLDPRLAGVMGSDQDQFRTLSPAGQLGGLRVPVFLLHGSGDDIIPWTEDLWLRRDIPAAELRASLVTDAIDHVNPTAAAGWRAEVSLVRFWGGVLRATN